MNQTVCALRFFYGVTLGFEAVPERIPYARRPKTLPVVLSAEEVVRFLEAVPSLKCRTALTAVYAGGFRVSEVCAVRVTKPKGGQFVLHAAALHGNPYDGHTLGPVVAAMEKLTGVEVRRIHVDKGYRGHGHANKFRVWTSGQVRRVTKTIRREMRRRAAVEPVIGHVKAEHRMDRNYLKGRDGDRANAVLAAAGYNFSLLIRWFEDLLRALITALFRTALTTQTA